MKKQPKDFDQALEELAKKMAEEGGGLKESLKGVDPEYADKKTMDIYLKDIKDLDEVEAKKHEENMKRRKGVEDEYNDAFMKKTNPYFKKK